MSRKRRGTRLRAISCTKITNWPSFVQRTGACWPVRIPSTSRIGSSWSWIRWPRGIYQSNTWEQSTCLLMWIRSLCRGCYLGSFVMRWWMYLLSTTATLSGETCSQCCCPRSKLRDEPFLRRNYLRRTRWCHLRSVIWHPWRHQRGRYHVRGWTEIWKHRYQKMILKHLCSTSV